MIGTPAIVEIDDWLVLLWPDEMPDAIEITAEALESLVNLVNRARHPEAPR